MSEQVETEQLRAEVEHWKDHAKEAGEGFSRVCKDYARVSARNVELVRRLDAIRALVRSPEADQYRDEACRHAVAQPYADNRYVRLLDAVREEANPPTPESTPAGVTAVSRIMTEVRATTRKTTPPPPSPPSGTESAGEAL